MISFKRSISLGICTSFLALTATSQPLFAQSVPEQKTDSESTDATDDNAIIVTGSRIARPNYDTVEPVIVVGAKEIEGRGFSTLGQALSEQPAFGVPGATPVGGQSSFGPGQNFVDFFSLGSQRTLTLVNGRRFVGSNNASIFGPTGSGGSQVDLNIIPTKLIERVETIAVGGAPIYGSDAIAGTVNIILKRDYEGFDLDGQYGISSRGDAADYRVRALGGMNFADGRGNIVASAEYNKANGLLATDRALTSSGNFFADTTNANDTVLQRIFADRRIPSISQFGIPLVGDFIPTTPAQSQVLIGDSSVYGVQANGMSGPQLRFDPTGNLIPIDFGSPVGLASDFNTDSSGGNGYSLVPVTNLLSVIERVNGNLIGQFKFTDNIRFFGEAWYSRSTGVNLADQPSYNSALFGGTDGNLVLSVDNPFLTAAARTAIVNSINNNPNSDQNFYGEGPQDYFYFGRANTDLTTGRSKGKNEVYRFVAGFDGSIDFNGHKLDWEIVGNYGRSTTSAKVVSINEQNFQNAINPLTTTNCGPGIVNSPAATLSSTCAPLNLFGSGVASQAAIDYVTSIADPKATNTQKVFTASIAGPLFDMPGGALSVALGYEHRAENQKFDPGVFFLGGPDNTPSVDENGDGNPNNDPSSYGRSVPIVGIDAGYNTDEIFGELRAGLINDEMNIPLIRTLEFQGAARYVNHSVSGGDVTWTAGGRWEPITGLTVRGNFTRAIRSPAITESSNPSQSYFGFAADACSRGQLNNGPDPTTRKANCLAAGIPANFSSLSNQRSFPQATAGDPTLNNEKSNSWTIGAIVKPRFLPGFNASIDYIDIKIKDVITELSADDIVAACYDSKDFPNNQFCRRIERDSSNQLSFILTGYANQAELRYKGILGSIDYTFDTPFLGATSKMNLNVQYQYLDTLSSRSGNAAPSNTAGNIGLSQHKA